MTNKIDYKEENENLRLKIELSKQKEKEMLIEKELIELRMRCNRECNKNENPLKEVVDNNVSKTEDIKTKDKDIKVVNFKPIHDNTEIIKPKGVIGLSKKQNEKNKKINIKAYHDINTTYET